MCNLKTIYAGTEGYVLQCAECRHVQIGFGTTKELEMLHHMLQSADDEMRTEALLQLFQS